MRGPGQPTKASPALARKIAGLIRNGVRMADAAEQCGIDRSTLFELMKRTGEPYESFAATIRAAVSAGKKPRQAG